MKKIIRRMVNSDDAKQLNHFPPLLQRLYTARGVTSPHEVDYDLTRLYPFHSLKNIEIAANVLYEALRDNKKIIVIGDFDADGATSSALAVSALRSFGAQNVDYLVPNRFEYGYGLTPEIVNVAKQMQPNLLITVDNGISSIAGVDAANRSGIDVLITDHHLPGASLPDARAIVNPNQKEDLFPSKNLAGVGVIFYTMLALRRKLLDENWFSSQGINEPVMSQFLDLVALGTIADVVPLDHNNRILVHQGLQRIRSGKCSQGINALLQMAKRSPHNLTALDLAFSIGPRLNAAGRLDDMSLGIECLLCQDLTEALEMAQMLEDLNNERRKIEKAMQHQVVEELSQVDDFVSQVPAGLCLYNEKWHQGVIGILAGRIKDRLNRPVVAFAKVNQHEIKGSARSVDSVHIRDVLDAIATEHPDLITKFGGHAMAAGLSLEAEKLSQFSTVFADQVAKRLDHTKLQGEVMTDGELNSHELIVEIAEMIKQAGPWGQAFPEPLFDGIFNILKMQPVGIYHLKLLLQHPSSEVIVDGIIFNADLEAWSSMTGKSLHLVYRLTVNEYQGQRKVQLMIEHCDLAEVLDEVLI